MKFNHQDLQQSLLNQIRQDYTTLRADQTVREALSLLRSAGPPEKIVYFYVIDRDRKLIGVVPTRRLLMSAPEQSIGSIMVDRIMALPSSATVMDACEMFLEHRLLAFPVVDGDGRIMGVIDIGMFTDEIVSLTEQRSLDNVFQLIGVHLIHGRRLSLWSGFRSRFPWLLSNLTGGLLCAAIVGLYESFLDAVIILALFIPVVLALSESVSIQSVTLTLQGLHQSGMKWAFFRRALWKEFWIATLLGLCCGGLVGLAAWAWKGVGLVSLAIGLAIWLSMITACVAGVALPMAVHALRRDPQIAAGPIVLALTDLATLLLYFNLAGLILRGLP